MKCEYVWNNSFISAVKEHQHELGVRNSKEGIRTYICICLVTADTIYYIQKKEGIIVSNIHRGKD